jgi:hypothetical protein
MKGVEGFNEELVVLLYVEGLKESKHRARVF